MKRFIPLMMVLSLSLIACEQNINTPPQPSPKVDIDKTEKHIHERNLGAATPDEYSETNIPTNDARSTNPDDITERNMRREEGESDEAYNDRALASRVRNTLMLDDSLSKKAQYTISVEAKKGVVTLQGRLSKQERDLVEKKARAISGVVDVVNRIVVTESPYN